MPVCAVITCKFGQEGNAEGIDFHPFPKDEEVRAKWLALSGRKDWEPDKTDFVCSRHFRDNDYTVKRSGKKYLKTCAIPCEYVVYRLSLIPEEESSEHEQSNEAEVKYEPEKLPADEQKQPMEEETVAQRDPEFFLQMDEQAGPSSSYMFPTMRPLRSQEPDSTLLLNENTCEPWENIQPERYFSQRLPFTLFEESSQEICSSRVNERPSLDVGSALNPYPLVDMGPHLQRLPLPRTPEPAEIHDEETQESTVDYQQGRAKLERIKKIVSGRKSSKKEEDTEPRQLRRRSRAGPGRRIPNCRGPGCG